MTQGPRSRGGAGSQIQIKDRRAESKSDFNLSVSLLVSSYAPGQLPYTPRKPPTSFSPTLEARAIKFTPQGCNVHQTGFSGSEYAQLTMCGL